ncbi:MAG: L,D-transpeptidase family protein [Solirubrobacterales bacterium]
MGRKARIFGAVAVGVLVLGAVAAYGYDASRSHLISDGVTINGVEVGGLDTEQAQTLIRKKVVEPRRRALRVEADGETYTLPARELKVRADVVGAVEDALDASREGSLPERVFRQVTGGSDPREVTLEVQWSRPALNGFVREVADGVYVAPRDASVEPGPESLTVVSEADGQKLRDNLLDSELESILTGGPYREVVKGRTRVLKPTVTRAEVSGSYPTYITVSKGSYTLTLWKDLEVAAQYPVAVGSPDYPTPDGLFSIQNMQVDPPWNVPNSDWAGDLAGTTVPGGAPDNPLRARWLGVSGAVGIHGTSSIYSLGSAASHGCIRMSESDVIALYDQVDVGTPIYIG